MSNKKPSSSLFSKVVYFFPLQLFFVHLKKNQQLLLFWVFLFLVISGTVGGKYGVPYLFLAPEYLGELSFASFFMVGFSIGGYVVAFNISSYIMNAFRFPFLATLSKPFYKYSINNSVIPTIFLVYYFYYSYSFLSNNEIFTNAQIALRWLGFLSGYFLFLGISAVYFLATNKDFEKLFGRDLAKVISSDGESDEVGQILLKKKKERDFYPHEKTWRVDSYVGSKLGLKITRPYHHYDNNMISQVFKQNHVNASFFQIAIIVSIIILGLFREIELFNIPAGATIMLLVTTAVMISSAIRSWIKGWTLSLILIGLFLLNFLTQYDNFYYDSKAYGMTYDTKVDYAKSFIAPTKSEMNEDLQRTYGKLDNWKSKQNSKLPKAVFVSLSGGGSRAAYWSFLSLKHLNKVTNGELMKHSVLFTGSSGGLIGASYFREKYVRNIENEADEAIAKDLLNPVMFTLAVNDLLIRTQRFELNGTKHWKDRGYILEQRLNKNTFNYFNRPIADYRKLEQEASIPSVIFTPSIINDSRRLLVGTTPQRFMQNELNDWVDFQSLFKNNNAEQVKYSTLLRMNASFPYITPSISLPTEPRIEAFDSGLRDNYGIKTTVNYIHSIKDWLEKNTSGVIILQVRDVKYSDKLKAKYKSQSLIGEMLSPFGSVYGNWFDVQDYNNDEILHYLDSWYEGEVDVFNYELNKTVEENISLSWHLTHKEKQQIINSVHLKENIEIEKNLIQLLK